jgi:hypothetical protein
LWALGVLGRRLVVAEQAVEEVLVQPGCIEGRAPAAVGESEFGGRADVLTSDLGAALPRRVGHGGARGDDVGAHPVDLEARTHGRDLVERPVAEANPPQALLRRGDPGGQVDLRRGIRRLETGGVGVEGQPPADDVRALRGIATGPTSTVRPKRSSNWGRSSPSSGFMVPIRTMRAGCETETPSRSTVLRPMAAASRSRSTRWSWRRLTSST